MAGSSCRTNAGPAPEALAASIGTAILAADGLGLERTRAALAEALRQLDTEATVAPARRSRQRWRGRWSWSPRPGRRWSNW